MPVLSPGKRGRLCEGLNTLPRKKTLFTETMSKENTTSNGCGVLTCGPPADDYLIDSVEEPTMVRTGQSRKEPRERMRTLTQPKIKLNIGTWNVRTMSQVGKTKQIVNEMSNYNIDILGVAEARWTGFGEMNTSDKYHILYSGDDTKHEKGVAIIMSEKAKKSLLDWQPVNNRIIKANFFSKFAKLTVIQAYAPTNDADEETKTEF